MPPRKRTAAAPSAAEILLAAAAATASPPTSAGSAGAAAQPAPAEAAAASQTETPPGPCSLEVDEQPLETLPDGKEYESCDEDDGPSRILEDETLVALAQEKEPAVEQSADSSPAKQPATSGGASAAAASSPTRARSVITGAVNAIKKLTAAQQRKQEVCALSACAYPMLHASLTCTLFAAQDDKKWSALKTDGTETRCFGRPDFAPFKDGTAPEGFQAAESNKRGGPRPDARAKYTSKTHPAEFIAGQGFDKKLFTHIRESTNEYAAAKGAGSDDHYPEYKSFSVVEIVCCFGLLLRNGLNPYPQMDQMFEDPSMSFVWGDERARKALPGVGCGGPARRFNQFRSFCHIQTNSPLEWKVADPATGEFKKINFASAGPMRKLEPMLSYCRFKWGSCWLPGMNLSLDEMTMGFKGRCAMVTRIKYKKEGDADGFQCDCICEDGYCITFWFRCDNPPCPVPKDVSDRDNRCAWLVDQLPGKWYRLFMDNLFTSWKFGEMLAKRQCLFAGAQRHPNTCP
jgi:hypothetical protein